MSRILTEEQQHWCDVIGEFAKKEIEPIMLDWDKVTDPSKAIPFDAYAKAFKLGLNAFEIPKEYGGSKVDLATAAVMYEEMGYYDGNFASVMQTTNLALKPVLIGGTPEQVQYFSKHILEGKGYACFCLTEPQSGSDASNVKTTAVKDGDEWVINGEKCFITNGGEADIACVFAMTDPSKGTKGISAFMVPTNLPGFSVTKYEDKCGFRAISTCALKFDHVRVPASNLVGEEGKGYIYAMKTLDKSRACVGALAVGIARRALDEAIAFVKERVTFGAPVSKRQGIQWMIADMATKIEASRQLVIHANDLQSKGLPFSKEAAMAKMFATQSAMEVCTDAVQLMGGKGYMKEGCVEKCFRDIKAYCIFEGTNQIQKMVISGAVLSGHGH
ncbi:acyl-CoA dehydrogenase family protein [Evtepia sp.]|jgi:alkylation response protein AidB-like acyl-CoA dehydrogenase|uniref:acyl-CoA dehydrogenase family protein n=1 Tax=Evtepia sp. TaxID=2773933 RepID=UPI001D98460F|nr:acyl-CoA dehydrogenase family protein [Evtepia sp.]MBD9248140.1 acyl-CoA dehydrogenase [Clostridiales bacterium]MDD7085521.1 acyl-CoA dehydrogenase family protein [Clostridiales bacterium]MEE0256352.1 acyl-CoA dehydrogenase family protein [Evtepia sp.]